MSFAGPVNAPIALNPVVAVRVRFMEAYSGLIQIPAYTDWEKFTFLDDPAGDVIYTIYAEPGVPLKAWYGDRPMSSFDFDYWTQAVRTFGQGYELDVDDLKDDANPAKRQMYLMTAQKAAEAAVLLWPSLVAETLVNSISKIWLPDGQHIFDLHPTNPRNPSGSTFRNYWANNSQGGGAAKPLTYGNVLAGLVNGYTLKAPNGFDYPARYTKLAVPPGSKKFADRICKFDRLPVMEVEGQATSTSNAGGDTVNEINKSYGLEPVELGNMPAGMWALIDDSLPSEKPLAIKKRQEITWQYTQGGQIIAGFPAGDEGLVSTDVFKHNKTFYGPKARGEGYIRNWWRVALFDGNSTPVTALSVVS